MSKSLRFILILVTVLLLVIGLDFFGFELLSSSIELLIVPSVTLVYILYNKDYNKHLSYFLIVHSIANIIGLIDLDSVSNWSYYVCNILYIISYVFLLLDFIKSLNFRLIFKEFLLYFIVLLLLDVSMIYALAKIIQTIDFVPNSIKIIQALEFIYHFVIVVLLSLSFLNYLQNQISKFLYLFIACVLITFSEILLNGYYYFVEDIRLNYISIILFYSGIFVLVYSAIYNTSVSKPIPSKNF